MPEKDEFPIKRSASPTAVKDERTAGSNIPLSQECSPEESGEGFVEDESPPAEKSEQNTGDSDLTGPQAARPRAENRAARGRNSERTGPPSTVQELIEGDLRGRAEAANVRLRAQLLGSILIHFVNSGKKYLFDWSTDNLVITSTVPDTADCVIRITEQNLLRVVSGDLNPQIAMLSDKINVSGRLSLAVYFFNLIVPHSGGDRAGSSAEGR